MVYILRTSYARKYWVVFERTNKLHWWNKFINEYQHCYLLTESLGGVIKINPTLGGVSIEEYCCNITTLLDNIDYLDIIEVNVYDRNLVNPKFRGIKTCVSIIKDFLGISDLFVITPYQLRRKLNGKFLFSSQTGHISTTSSTS